MPPLVGEWDDEVWLSALGDCRVPDPTLSGDGGRWKGEGTGGAAEGEALRFMTEGWREPDLRYESTAPSQSIDGD